MRDQLDFDALREAIGLPATGHSVEANDKLQHQGHRLIRGWECNHENSDHSYETGYDFFYCTCGGWRGEYQGRRAASINHELHLAVVYGKYMNV